jgi:hypothetical protein
MLMNAAPAVAIRGDFLETVADNRALAPPQFGNRSDLAWREVLREVLECCAVFDHPVFGTLER